MRQPRARGAWGIGVVVGLGACAESPPPVPPTAAPAVVSAAPVAPRPAPPAASVAASGKVRSLRSMAAVLPPDPDCEAARADHTKRPWTPPPAAKWEAAHRVATGHDPAKERAFGPAAVDFAIFLNGMHCRIHPVFADSYLEALDKRPKDDPENAPKLKVRLEIAIAADGSVARLGVLSSSGVTAFDDAALEVVDRVAPYRVPPESVRSADGLTWMVWDFVRDEIFACSTMNVRPYLYGP